MPKKLVNILDNYYWNGPDHNRDELNWLRRLVGRVLQHVKLDWE